MRNKDNLNCFNQWNDADSWVWRIENGVGDWVRKHDKSYWYLVLWESKRNGTLIETISQKDFAKLLFQECPDAIADSDTADTIFHSIEKFKYKKKLKDFENLPKASALYLSVKELSELLTRDVLSDDGSIDFNLETRMHEFLTMTTANEQHVKVCYHPQYNGKSVTFSLESYVSKCFMDAHRPSYTVLFECVDETLTVEKVEMYYGRFCSLSNTKLFIASTHPFSGCVKKEAERHDIGLLLVNTNYKINENSFVLPRTKGSLPDEVLWHQMLVGERKITASIIAYDGQRIADSLSFILYEYAFCARQNLFVSERDEGRYDCWGFFADGDTLVNCRDEFAQHYTRVFDFHGEHRMNNDVLRDVIIPAAKRILKE